MGGAFGNPSGNVTPWAEFNFWADPLAASIACESVPLFIIPLDVTERVRFTTADSEALAASGSRFAAELLSASLALHREELGLGWSLMHDAVALMAVVAPELFSTESMALEVVTEGDQAGHVSSSGNLLAKRQTVRVAMNVDAETVHDELIHL